MGGTAVHFIRFRSDIPLDHLSRGLDELRRAGFGLCAVSVTAGDKPDQGTGGAAPGLAEIRIDFRPEGALPPQLLLDRIARMPGIRDLRGGPASG